MAMSVCTCVNISEYVHVKCIIPAVMNSRDGVGVRLEGVSDRVESKCCNMNTQVYATATMSYVMLPAVLGGPGGGLDCGTDDDRGSGGDPVPAVFGSKAREYSTSG